MQDQAKAQLKIFLSNFPELDEPTLNALTEAIPVSYFPKGTILVKSGEIPKECYHVLNGMVREYQFVDGTERTIEFYNESNGSVSSDHYTSKTPSDSFLECAEDCLLIVGEMQMEKEHLEQFPALKEITRRMVEANLYSTKKTLANFILSSPKKRYLNLLETRPDLLNRAPLHQIASYLGMTPESLSRIRKRIFEKKD